MADLAKRLWDIVEPFVAAEGVELDDVEVIGNERARILRVTVDAKDGVGVDRIATLSRGVGRLLEAEDFFSDAYTLELSSPGLERKLRLPNHYLKSVGREAKVKTRVEIDGARNHRGAIVSADDKGFTLGIDGADRRIEFDDVVSARTVFVWDKSAKSGARR